MEHVSERRLHARRAAGRDRTRDGHQAHFHLPKGLAWYALFAIPGRTLIERLTRRKGGMRKPAARTAVTARARRAPPACSRTPLTQRSERLASLRARRRTASALQAHTRPARSDRPRRLFRDFRKRTTRVAWRAHPPHAGSYVHAWKTITTPIQRIAMVEGWAADASRGWRETVRGGAARRLGQVPDSLAGRPFRPGVLHGVEQLLHEPRREVHARDDDPGTSPSSTSWSIRAKVIVNS